MNLLVLEILARELKRRNREAVRLALRDLLRRRARPTQLSDHLDAAVQWLERAQDVTGSGGVAHGYLAAWHPGFRTVGWLPAYPETTGYIIPTLFDYAATTRDGRIRDRAIAMADWEIEVQMPSGAVRGGTIDQPPTPAVFNTGQVIFGWVRAAHETGNDRYAAAASRAGLFLTEHQDEDGVWRKGLSRYAKPGVQTYNTRTAWALLELAELTGDRRYRDAGLRNIDAALARQLPNGWFPDNCLDTSDTPITHTIAYATRGVLEAGILLGNEAYIAAANKVADALVARQRSNGSLAGRYDRDWRAAASWSCLTGNAQVAIIWLRLAQATGDTRYTDAAARCLLFLASLQNLHAADDGVRGGIAGSYPIFAEYGRFEYLNWAAKFFADAVMLAERRAGAVLESTSALGSPAATIGVSA